MITSAPLIACRCCYQPLEALAQEGFRRMFRILTCRNPRCPMFEQTLADEDYADVELGLYGVVMLGEVAQDDMILLGGLTLTAACIEGGAVWTADGESVFEHRALDEYVRVIGQGEANPALEEYIRTRGWR